jgi:hypothetical protein
MAGGKATLTNVRPERSATPCLPEQPALPRYWRDGLSGLDEMMDGELGCGRGRAGPTRSNLQRTGATTIDPRWQVCRATLRHTA